MKVIKPTPSQAAVAVQKLLRKHGVEVQLGVAQEAIAASEGYPSWNVLAADMDPRGRIPRPAPQQAAAKASQEEEVLPWDFSCEDEGPPIRHFERQSRRTKTDSQADDLRLELDAALAATGLLKRFTRQRGRDECAMEAASPYVQVSYEMPWNDAFATELVFTLRDHKLQCYVRTWEFKDRLRPSHDYEIFMEHDGRFDTDATRPDASKPVADLVRSALKELHSHKRDLQNEVNVQ